MLENFNWQFVFKRFIVCFLLLVIAKTFVAYYKTNIFALHTPQLIKSFTFALLYSLFSGYMYTKNNPKN
jgi:hypothetical protein